MTVTNQNQNQIMTDYKNYSLSQLENWLHDAISCNEITATEIYNTIKSVIQEEYNCYKKCADRCSDFLNLINNTSFLASDYSDNYCDNSIFDYHYHVDPQEKYNEYWSSTDTIDPAGNNVSNIITSFSFDANKWSIPVEVDDPSGFYYLTFPEDLIKKLEWKEGDNLEFVSNNNGTFTVKKV